MDLTRRHETRCGASGGAHLWAVVLAGGDGARVRRCFTDREGRTVPKQFCSVDGQESLVRWAIGRAGRIVPHDRIVVVVAEKHREWWLRELADIPVRNRIVQPSNRGTAAGLLLPVLEVLRRDPRATLLVLPSDHYVADEESVRRAVVEALAALDREPDRVVLLGMSPRDEDTEYGWIVPDGPPVGVQRVATFVEKPDRRRARALLGEGGLLNSLILVGRGRTLLQLNTLAVPDLVGEFAAGYAGPTGRRANLSELYRTLPCRDFSKEVLQRCCGSLSVVRVGECGWTDLGTPERLAEFRDLRARDRRATA